MLDIRTLRGGELSLETVLLSTMLFDGSERGKVAINR
jgi:hypothetical protein